MDKIKNNITGTNREGGKRNLYKVMIIIDEINNSKKEEWRWKTLLH